MTFDALGLLVPLPVTLAACAEVAPFFLPGKAADFRLPLRSLASSSLSDAPTSLLALFRGETLEKKLLRSPLALAESAFFGDLRSLVAAIPSTGCSTKLFSTRETGSGEVGGVSPVEGAEVALLRSSAASEESKSDQSELGASVGRNRAEEEELDEVDARELRFRGQARSVRAVHHCSSSTGAHEGAEAAALLLREPYCRFTGGRAAELLEEGRGSEVSLLAVIPAGAVLQDTHALDIYVSLCPSRARSR